MFGRVRTLHRKDCIELETIAKRKSDCETRGKQKLSRTPCTFIKYPNRTFHIFRALKSVDRRLRSTYILFISGFWGSKVGKGPIGIYFCLTYVSGLSGKISILYLIRFKRFFYRYTYLYPKKALVCLITFFFNFTVLHACASRLKDTSLTVRSTFTQFQAWLLLFCLHLQNMDIGMYVTAS